MEMRGSTKVKKMPSKIEEMTKEQVRQAILKKRECNAKAQKIVESLLEKDVTEEYLLKCLPDINQSHFEDIMEERSIIRLCGYPICSKVINDKDIPKQKYRISVKTNKVYDITTRKNFCSNECYKSGMYVKKQLLTSPLWFRDYEVLPKFNLLPLGTAGSMGQEVDVAFVEKLEIKSNSDNFKSIHDFASASLREISSEENEFADLNHKSFDDNIQDDKDKKDNNISLPPKQQISVADTIKKPDEKILNSNIVNLSNETRHKKPTMNPLNIVGEIIERPEKKIDPILTTVPETTKDDKKKVQIRKQPLITVLTIDVEKCLAQWFTLDTIIYIFGEQKAKEMVEDKGEAIKEYLNNFGQGLYCNSVAYDQYQILCKKLNILELEDRKFDTQTLQKETRPLPDYSILQEESKKMQLKVKAFLAGETDVPETEQSKDQIPEENESLTQLPLVDKNAQHALRRRIVCQHLNKVLPDLLRSLGLLSLTVSSDIRLLVNSFKLQANNIMFKPIQWTLIAMVFIKLLSIKDSRLEHLLEQPTAFQHMQLLLLSYKQDGGYLDRLISWLIDIDRLIDTNDTQLTIE